MLPVYHNWCETLGRNPHVRPRLTQHMPFLPLAVRPKASGFPSAVVDDQAPASVGLFSPSLRRRHAAGRPFMEKLPFLCRLEATEEWDARPVPTPVGEAATSGA